MLLLAPAAEAATALPKLALGAPTSFAALCGGLDLGALNGGSIVAATADAYRFVADGA